LEFALVAVPFLFLLIAAMDLGRYFITQHSLRTLTSEAAR
jgi:Flp pilus assembly protein TadG